VLDQVRNFQPILICRFFALNQYRYDADMLRVTERPNMSDIAESEYSGGEPVAAAAADAFDLSSVVKYVHSRFSNSAKRPQETDRYT